MFLFGILVDAIIVDIILAILVAKEILTMTECGDSRDLDTPLFYKSSLWRKFWITKETSFCHDLHSQVPQ